MANYVDKQGDSIAEIAKSTDDSHEKAKAGLGEVQKAAAYQPVCVIS